jgi:molybdopterin molybdotransferase
VNEQRIPFADAIRLVGELVPAGPTEAVPTESAHGRITAAAVIAQRDCPPFDMAAMDGFAITALDPGATSERQLHVGHPQFAGDPAPPLAATEARPIATGAALPLGANAVLTKEMAQLSGSMLLLSEELAPGLNVRRRGEDARIGEAVLPPGRRIHPAAIGALCAYGVSELEVRCPPKIAVISLGDEIAAVGRASSSDVIDANGPMVSAMFATAGCAVVRQSVADDRAAIAQALRALVDHVDIIVTTGGASVGEHDLARPAIEAIGGIVHFHGVHMRPGKPAIFATHPSGCSLFGLPGNPVAALVAARFFVARAVRARLGLGAEIPLGRPDEAPEDGPSRILKIAYSIAKPALRITVLPGQQSHMGRVPGGGVGLSVAELTGRALTK